MIKNTSPLSQKTQKSCTAWIKSKQNKLRFITQSITSTKKMLKENWISFLELKENKLIDVIETEEKGQRLEKIMSIRDVESEDFLKITKIKVQSNNQKVKNRLKVKELYLGIIKDDIKKINNLEKSYNLLIRKMIKKIGIETKGEVILSESFDILSLKPGFIKNCLEGPKNLRVLIKQYRKMNRFSRFFRSIIFSMPKNILDYISDENKLNPLGNKKVKKSLMALNRISKDCIKLQVLSFVLFYVKCFSLVLFDDRLFNNFLSIRNLLEAGGLFILYFPSLLFNFLLRLIMNERINFVEELDFTTLTIFTLSMAFWIGLDIKNALYMKNFEIMKEEVGSMDNDN